MITVTVPSVDRDGGSLTLAPSDENGQCRVIASNRRGESLGVVVGTLDLAAAVRALLASQIDPAAREAIREALDQATPDVVPPAADNGKPKYSAARVAKATRDVIRNLLKDADSRHSETMLDYLARNPTFDEFVRAAKAWLGDNSELSSATIEAADYREVREAADL